MFGCFSLTLSPFVSVPRCEVVPIADERLIDDRPPRKLVQKPHRVRKTAQL